MHDPMTVAFHVRIPLWKSKPQQIRSTDDGSPITLPGFRRYISLVTIWHNDLNIGGDDDSCRPERRKCREQRTRDMVESWASSEVSEPWLRKERAKIPSSPADAECLLRGALWHVATCFRLNRWSIKHKRLTFAAVTQLANELIHNPTDNVRGDLCLLPGWHTNDRMVYEAPVDIEDLDMESPEWEQEMDRRAKEPDHHYPAEASDWGKKDCAERVYWMCCRILFRETARWWQKPRWHIRHWSFQVHAWQRFKRRWIERCDKCKKRFKGSTSVFSDWHGTRKWCAECNEAPPVSEVTPAQFTNLGNADDGILG